MARKQNNTPKKVAKKRATMRVNEMRDEGAKPFKPIDEDSPEFMYGVTRGIAIAREDRAKRDANDPWVRYNEHNQNVQDINARLDDLDAEKRRLTLRLRKESAARDGFRIMILAEAGMVPDPIRG